MAENEPATNWSKVVAKLEKMEERGILLPADRKFIAIAKQELAKLE